MCILYVAEGVREEGRLATSAARFHPARSLCTSGLFYDSSHCSNGKWRKVSLTKAASRKRNDVESLLNEMRTSVSRTFRERGDSFH